MLEKFKRSIDRSVASVGLQSSTYLEIGKLRTKIENVNAGIHQANFELGENIYTQWKTGEMNQEYIETVCQNIQKLEQEAREYQERITWLEEEKTRILSEQKMDAPDKAATTTFACGHINDPQAKFCTVCGSPAIRAEENAKAVCCEKCGSVLEEGAKFCSNCGAAQNGNA